MKRLVIVLVAVALVGVGVAGAQIVQPSRIIPQITGTKQGGWVKIDKSPKNPNYQKVYCVTIDNAPSCDWSDVRVIRPRVSVISED